MGGDVTHDHMVRAISSCEDCSDNQDCSTSHGITGLKSSDLSLGPRQLTLRPVAPLPRREVVVPAPAKPIAWLPRRLPRSEALPVAADAVPPAKPVNIPADRACPITTQLGLLLRLLGPGLLPGEVCGRLLLRRLGRPRRWRSPRSRNRWRSPRSRHPRGLHGQQGRLGRRMPHRRPG